MEENEHKDKQNLNGEIDPFSRFLFGNRNHRGTYEEKENNSNEQKNHVSFSHDRPNQIDHWFFGPMRRERDGAPSNQSQIGNRNYRGTYEEDENNSNEQKEHVSFSHDRSNQIDNWLFGSRRTERDGAPSNQSQIGNQLSNADFELLMETIDMFVETSKQYKPLLKNVPIFFNQLIKKFMK